MSRYKHLNMAERVLRRQKEWEWERECATPRACAPWSYMPKHLSRLPSALRSPLPLLSQLTSWIFGSPICVRLVVAFIRYIVVSCREHCSAMCKFNWRCRYSVWSVMVDFGGVVVLRVFYHVYIRRFVFCQCILTSPFSFPLLWLRVWSSIVTGARNLHSEMFVV